MVSRLLEVIFYGLVKSICSLNNMTFFNCQVFGIAIAIAGDEAQPVLTFFSSITVIMMRITQWIIMLAPVGVLFLVKHFY